MAQRGGVFLQGVFLHIFCRQENDHFLKDNNIYKRLQSNAQAIMDISKIR